MTRKKRLGRGLEALLNATETDHDATVAVLDAAPAAPSASTFIDRNHDGIPDGAQPELRTHRPVSLNKISSTDTTSDIVHLGVFEIEDNPFQPRRVFSEPEIVSLAESLKEHDILQPILVRVVDGRYQLISGERRLRAAIKAEWQTIPARIRKADDRLVSELAIVENLQRKDLNAIEKALSFRRYIDEHRCTQDDLAKRLKIDRSTIGNLMRLLELPSRIQEFVQSGAVSAGHARALLPLGESRLQNSFCDKIRAEGLSVRATEQLVGDRITGDESSGGSRKARARDHQIEALQQELRMVLGTGVKIRKGARGRGQIVISFANGTEFERIRELLTT